jgi:hypothetical protein
MKFPAERVFSLILGPESFRAIRGFCLLIIKLFQMTIGKKIRSITLSAGELNCIGIAH